MSLFVGNSFGFQGGYTLLGNVDSSATEPKLLEQKDSSTPVIEVCAKTLLTPPLNPTWPKLGKCLDDWKLLVFVIFI